MPEWIAHPEEWGVAALVATVAIVGIFVLLRLILGGARALGGAAGAAALPAKQYQRVLLPALPETGYSEEVVSLACRLASGVGGHDAAAAVVLTYVIQVPRALAPNAEMPEEEAAAQRTLSEAATFVKRCGLQPVTRIRKARGVVEEMLRAIAEEKADLLVLMVTPASAANRSELLPAAASLTRELARRAPCEVVFARAASA